MKPSVKSDFPIFDDSDLVYLDNASTTQKPQQVLDAIQSMYSKTNANVHRALYDIGSEASLPISYNALCTFALFLNTSTVLHPILVEVFVW